MMKKKRSILYFGNKLSRHGSTPTYIESLTSDLSENYNILSASDKKNIAIRMVDMLFFFFLNIKKCDIIIIDTYSTLAFYFSFVISQLSRLFNKPYISILHGGNLPKRITKNAWLSKQIFQYSVINIAPSHYLYEKFAAHNYNVQYIPNAIHIEDYKFKIRKNVKPNLLYVRSFHKVYNPLMAVRVLTALKEKYPDVKLCMVGPDKDGSLQEVLKLAHDLKVQKNLITPGFMSKKDWHELAKSFDIFINTTDHDNTPVSVIEAMALGLPVVSTNAGGIPYLVKNNVTGLLVEKNNHQTMAEAIKKLIEGDPAFAQELVVNARKKVENFDWQVVKYKWFNIINSAIEKNSAIENSHLKFK